MAPTLLNPNYYNWGKWLEYLLNNNDQVYNKFENYIVTIVVEILMNWISKKLIKYYVFNIWVTWTLFIIKGFIENILKIIGSDLCWWYQNAMQTLTFTTSKFW